MALKFQGEQGERERHRTALSVHSVKETARLSQRFSCKPFWERNRARYRQKFMEDGTIETHISARIVRENGPNRLDNIRCPREIISTNACLWGNAWISVSLEGGGIRIDKVWRTIDRTLSNCRTLRRFIICSGSGYIWIFHMVSECGFGGLTGPTSKTVLRDWYRFRATVAPSRIALAGSWTPSCVRLNRERTLPSAFSIVARENKMTWILRAVMIVPPWKLGRKELALWRFSGVITFSISGPLLVDSIANSIMKTCMSIIYTVQENRKYLPGSHIRIFLLPWDLSSWFRLCSSVYSGHICFGIKHQAICLHW
jgi:hypothetical protein